MLDTDASKKERPLDSHEIATHILGRDDAITAEWLTECLRDAGILPQGHVETLRQTENEAFTSRATHLIVEYSDGTPPDAPSALFLKRMDRGWGELEIRFYQAAMEDPTEGADDCFPRCFEAAFEPATGDSHLLLQDVSETHVAPISRSELLSGRGMPTDLQLQGIMTSLARFHARWWQDSRIGRSEPFLIRTWYCDEASFQAHVRRREQELGTLNEAGAVPQPILKLYGDILRRLPRLWSRYLAERIATRRALTVSHGDCYLTQWLCPREGSDGTYLIDFDSVSGNLGAFDLVFLMASFWNREQRRAVETNLLRLYHRVLADEGVTGYEWESLTLDYRLMLSFYVFDPVFDHANGSPRSYWWPKMSCLMDAYEDWDCAEL